MLARHQVRSDLAGWQARLVHEVRDQEPTVSTNHHVQKSIRSSGTLLIVRDDQWFAKLRGLGMTSDDEWKLANLRPHIWKVSQLMAK